MLILRWPALKSNKDLFDRGDNLSLISQKKSWEANENKYHLVWGKQSSDKFRPADAYMRNDDLFIQMPEIFTQFIYPASVNLS